MRKVCSKCGKTKAQKEFHKDKRLKSGLTAACRGCRNKKSREGNKKHYLANRARMVKKHKAYRVRCRKLINEMKTDVPCRDCGRVLSPWQMQFDHVRGQKSFTIGQSPGQHGPGRILAEIDKCDVVCANCHEAKTWHARKKPGARNCDYGKRKWFISSKDGAACVDCSVEHPYYVMQYDHVRRDKTFNLCITSVYGRTLETLKEEAAKCELVCANCHFDRTYKRKFLEGKELCA